jgi:hypothetical protein
MCIPPRARANVLGIVNAMASAIVVYFMDVSFVVYIGDNRTLTIKFFFSAIEAANEDMSLPPLSIEQGLFRSNDEMRREQGELIGDSSAPAEKVPNDCKRRDE